MDKTNYPFERILWLIKLRWIAAIGVISTVYAASKIIAIPLAVVPLYSVAAALIIYNSFFLILITRLKNTISKNIALVDLLANFQISLDLLCLAVLIHFSGGIENPFIFYFIFHMIIASILLKRRAAFLQATYAVVLFLLMVFLEYSGIIEHYCLKGIFLFALHDKSLYVLGTSLAFTSTLYIAVYMATSISVQLRERERRLRAANRLLHEKDRIKSEYVLNVTHDIKEDLAAIHSCIDPVVEGITGNLNAGQKDLLFRAKARSKRLIFYINTLLNITKLKLAKELRMDYFSLSRLIKEVSEDIAGRAKSKDIDFRVKINISSGNIFGVRAYIQETILNLLANSVKYTLSGGNILLAAKEESDFFLIEIRDDGIGIPKNDIAHVFEEFYRAKNACEIEKQGTGLGLSIAKQIIQMHKGKIWVDSELGKGTNFYIELPKKM